MQKHCTNPLISRCGRCGESLARYSEDDGPAEWFCLDCDRWRLTEPSVGDLDDVEVLLLLTAVLISEDPS
jgi:hypothetical protein